MTDSQVQCRALGLGGEGFLGGAGVTSELAGGFCHMDTYIQTDDAWQQFYVAECAFITQQTGQGLHGTGQIQAQQVVKKVGQGRGEARHFVDQVGNGCQHRQFQGDECPYLRRVYLDCVG
ncbi:hypothetical protein D3C77_357980 [compost metagenome]